MNIRFEIEELGPIRNSVIDLNSFLLMCGDSQVGKSYVSFAVYYFFYIFKNPEIIKSTINESFDLIKIEKDLKENKEIKLQFDLSIIEEFYNKTVSRFIGNFVGDEDFRCKIKLTSLNNKNIEFRITQEKENEYIVCNEIAEANFSSIDFDYFIKNRFYTGILFLIESLLHISFISFKKIFILPPARGALMGLSFSTQKQLSNIGMYKEFIEDLEKILYPKFSPNIKDDEFLNELLVDLFGGEIKFRENNVYYKFKDSQIPITASASSIKELSPLFLILKNIELDNLSDLSILIEEPEAHLHPMLQRKVALLLSYLINQGGMLQITTHSDYFLNQINNVIKLHYLKQKSVEKFNEAINKLGINENCIFDPAKINAYYFKKNDDGFVSIEKLIIDEGGIPFTSFENIIDKMIQDTNYIDEMLDEIG
ncbi:MAG: hypothetical protein A2Y34_08190 [Spirochaetes bacterium GWC1_27_15]|nr:MAG: hypothetical protein A2Z98_04175 [Spirochaetes bacterium GWB1_27_13]OHD20020.1 MAG: hypothetical protein A2Y34_08190 [Spirochaetes bacterium GWC1_27_15]